MALAVAFVACQAAAPTPKDPEPGPQGPPGEAAPQLPYLSTPFEDVELAATGEMATQPVSLADHFVDPHKGQLAYSASSAPTGVVRTSVSGSTLTLTALKEGSTTVTVVATNKDGDSAFNQGARFTVTVMETVPPTLAPGGIPDLTLYKVDDAAGKTIVLTSPDDSSEGYFSHESAITYAVSSSPAGFVEAAEAAGVLTLTPIVTGQTIVTVVATADSKSVTDTFTVDVAAGSKPVPVPEPDPDPTPPMRKETIPDVSIESGRISVVILGDYFTPGAEGDELTYTASVNDAGKTVVRASVQTDDTLQILALMDGMATITVTATDADDESAMQTIMVTVAPEEPMLPPLAVGTIADQKVAAGSTVMVDVSEKFIEPEGEMLTYSANSDMPDYATAVVSAVGGVTITGVAVGDATITVTATDTDGLHADQMIKVTVSAAPEPAEPTTNGTIPAQTLDVAEIKTVPNIDLYFTPPEGETLTYTVDDGESLFVTARISGTTVTIRGDAYGEETVTVTATSTTTGKSVDQPIAVTVAKPAPVEPGPDPGPTPDPETTIDDVPNTLSITPTATMMYREVILPASYTLSVVSDVVSVTETIPANRASSTMNVWKVTARMEGMADVMVLNAGGMTAKTIMVTVTADPPMDDECQLSYTLDPSMPDGNMKECTLRAELSMRSDDSTKVRVDRKVDATGNVWVITAVAKTEMVIIRLLDGTTGEPAGSIEVEVLNQAPKRNTKADPPRATLIVDAAPADDDDETAIDERLSRTTPDAELDTYFTDADGDPLHYKITVSDSVALVKTDKKGFADITNAGKITLSILRNYKDVFTLTVEAYDGTDDKAAKAVGKAYLKHFTADPEKGTYTVDQYNSGRFDTLTIGNRLGVAHNLKVVDAVSVVDPRTSAGGFLFAEKLRQELIDAKMIPETATAAEASGGTEAISIPDTPANTDAGLDYYTITPSGTISAKLMPETGVETVDLGTGSLDFEVTANAPGTGMIKITYHVWVRSKSKGAVTTETGGAVGDRWESRSETITVNVKTCAEFADCP